MRRQFFTRIFILTILSISATFCLKAEDLNLAANSGKVGFLKSFTTISDEEQAALDFFTSSLSDESKVMTTKDYADMNVSNYDCIWIHIDRDDCQRGFNNLPADFTAEPLVRALQMYVAEGGNLLLTGQATQYLVGLKRISAAYAPTEYSLVKRLNNPDNWMVNPAPTEAHNHSNHKIFSSLSGDNHYGWYAYGLLETPQEFTCNDHNCMWKMTDIAFVSTEGDRISKFEADTYCSVLGTWGQIQNDEFAGIVEFYPLKNPDGTYHGTILANGLAAFQWAPRENNAQYDNLKRLAANMVSYLADENGEKPYNPGEAWVLDLAPRSPETLASTGRVAMYTTYENSDALASNPDEKAAYDWFVEKYGDDHVLFSDQLQEISTENYDCIWIHSSQEGTYIKDNKVPSVFNDEIIATLQNYVEAGGNLFLSKHAVQLAIAIGRTDKALSIFNSYDKSAIFDSAWDMNIAYQSGYDFSNHILFDGLQKEGGLIHLVTGNVSRFDFNCIWDMDESAKNSFRNAGRSNDSEILGTWGHNGGQNGVGMVIFYPKKESNKIQRRATDTRDIHDRKGTIIVNGLAAYQWALPDNQVNLSQGNIEKLTDNILMYLSPVPNEGMSFKNDYSVEHIASDGYINGEHTYHSYTLGSDGGLEVEDLDMVKKVEVTPILDEEWLSDHTWRDDFHGKNELTNSQFHCMYVGDPIAEINDNHELELHANVAGVYQVVVTSVYDNTYKFTVTIQPTLNNSNIYFEGSDPTDSETQAGNITFNESFDRKSTQIFTPHSGPIYYHLEYWDDPAPEKAIRRVSADASTPLVVDGVTLDKVSPDQKIDLTNAKEMKFVQKVNGLTTNLQSVTFNSETTGLSKRWEDAESSVKYFTLDGLEISLPKHQGIYIRVENGKASKIGVRK